MPETPKGSTPPSGEMSPEETAAFEKRVSDLGSKIDGAQAGKEAEITAQEDKAMRARGMAYGLRMSSEFVLPSLSGGSLVLASTNCSARFLGSSCCFSCWG